MFLQGVQADLKREGALVVSSVPNMPRFQSVSITIDAPVQQANDAKMAAAHVMLAKAAGVEMAPEKVERGARTTRYIYEVPSVLLPEVIAQKLTRMIDAMAGADDRLMGAILQQMNKHREFIENGKARGFPKDLGRG